MNFSSAKASVLALLTLAIVALLIFATRGPSQNRSRTSAQVREEYGQLPLSFEANRGQADASFNFLARGPGYTLALSPTKAMFALSERTSDASRSIPPAVLRMNLVGANERATVAGVNALEGKTHYLIGNDPSKWRTNIPTFGRVRYSEVYPGIDVAYYGNQRRLEYDFVVAPGSNADAIALEFAGAQRLEVEAATGDLLLGIGEKTIRQHKPIVYQETSAGRREVEGRYALRSNGQVGFEVGEYDASAALIIDPVLEYSTFLGGNGEDQAQSIAVDSTGNAYVAGFTQSSDFPIANAVQGTKGGGHDVFVTKLNAAGSALVYSTYIGGSNSELCWGIAVDSAGNAYVTGSTVSTNFPTVNALQSTIGGAGGSDAFVAKLNAAGSALVYSTYLGGSSSDLAIASRWTRPATPT